MFKNMVCLGLKAVILSCLKVSLSLSPRDKLFSLVISWKFATFSLQNGKFRLDWNVE